MEKFSVVKSKAIKILNDNIDTDIIIPKQYLKTIYRTGFQDYAFHPWRYDKDGNEIEDFPINKYKGYEILISGNNFGCGSSREHAAWALRDVGIKVIIAMGYSDIFMNNWYSNGLLPIIVSKDVRDYLASLDEEIEIDLEQQLIKTNEKDFKFDISKVNKDRLLSGRDYIDETLEYESLIKEYEGE
ncbi:MAG: 3-isopropylmalate dehydratase small subunit [Erysipelotrichaceae bacterium]|jgi:3-isopropylmalate/(R)-2-methylmalate dehydratase small subunit|nr:3-isopropylmalate dehydratase small subunit [Bacillota bacterium]NLP22394.1 3-isopropylmalate dehydratase small subunit [Erysipelotrichaceae bacterium]